MTTTTESTTLGKPARVEVIDINMPFMSMMLFMVKWALASIPALIVLALVGAAAAGVFTAAVGSMSILQRTQEQSKQQSEYDNRLSRYNDDCSQFKGRTVVADNEQSEFRACQAQLSDLRVRARVLDLPEP